MITWIDVKPTFPSSLGNGYAEVHHKWGIRSKPIPDICHFFYTGKILGELNLHRKTPIFCIKSVKKTPIFRVKSVKNAIFSRKICRKCQFFALNL